MTRAKAKRPKTKFFSTRKRPPLGALLPSRVLIDSIYEAFAFGLVFARGFAFDFAFGLPSPRRQFAFGITVPMLLAA